MNFPPVYYSLPFGCPHNLHDVCGQFSQLIHQSLFQSRQISFFNHSTLQVFFHSQIELNRFQQVTIMGIILYASPTPPHPPVQEQYLTLNYPLLTEKSQRWAYEFWKRFLPDLPFPRFHISSDGKVSVPASFYNRVVNYTFFYRYIVDNGHIPVQYWEQHNNYQRLIDRFHTWVLIFSETEHDGVNFYNAVYASMPHPFPAPVPGPVLPAASKQTFSNIYGSQTKNWLLTKFWKSHLEKFTSKESDYSWTKSSEQGVYILNGPFADQLPAPRVASVRLKDGEKLVNYAKLADPANEMIACKSSMVYIYARSNNAAKKLLNKTKALITYPLPQDTACNIRLPVTFPSLQEWLITEFFCAVYPPNTYRFCAISDSETQIIGPAAHTFTKQIFYNREPIIDRSAMPRNLNKAVKIDKDEKNTFIGSHNGRIYIVSDDQSKVAKYEEEILETESCIPCSPENATLILSSYPHLTNFKLNSRYDVIQCHEGDKEPGTSFILEKLKELVEHTVAWGMAEDTKQYLHKILTNSPNQYFQGKVRLQKLPNTNQMKITGNLASITAALELLAKPVTSEKIPCERSLRMESTLFPLLKIFPVSHDKDKKHSFFKVVGFQEHIDELKRLLPGMTHRFEISTIPTSWNWLRAFWDKPPFLSFSPLDDCQVEFDIIHPTNITHDPQRKIKSKFMVSITGPKDHAKETWEYLGKLQLDCQTYHCNDTNNLKLHKRAWEEFQSQFEEKFKEEKILAYQSGKHISLVYNNTHLITLPHHQDKIQEAKNFVSDNLAGFESRKIVASPSLSQQSVDYACTLLSQNRFALANKLSVKYFANISVKVNKSNAKGQIDIACSLKNFDAIRKELTETVSFDVVIRDEVLRQYLRCRVGSRLTQLSGLTTGDTVKVKSHLVTPEGNKITFRGQDAALVNQAAQTFETHLAIVATHIQHKVLVRSLRNCEKSFLLSVKPKAKDDRVTVLANQTGVWWDMPNEEVTKIEWFDSLTLRWVEHSDIVVDEFLKGSSHTHTCCNDMYLRIDFINKRQIITNLPDSQPQPIRVQKFFKLLVSGIEEDLDRFTQKLTTQLDKEFTAVLLPNSDYTKFSHLNVDIVQESPTHLLVYGQKMLLATAMPQN